MIIAWGKDKTKLDGLSEANARLQKLVDSLLTDVHLLRFAEKNAEAKLAGKIETLTVQRDQALARLRFIAEREHKDAQGPTDRELDLERQLAAALRENESLRRGSAA